MLQQIGQYVTGSAAAGGFDRSEAHMTRNALRLDERGWQQLATATRKWLREAEKIQHSAAQRMNGASPARVDGDAAVDSSEPTRAGLDVGLVVMLFEGRPGGGSVAGLDGAGPAAASTD